MQYFVTKCVEDVMSLGVKVFIRPYQVKGAQLRIIMTLLMFHSNQPNYIDPYFVKTILLSLIALFGCTTF